MTSNSIFLEQLGWGGLRNSNEMSAFADLFSDRDTGLSSDILIAKYKNAVQRNWDNYDLDNSNIYDSNKREHGESKIEIRNEVGNNQTGNEDLDKFLDNNSDKFYNVYNYISGNNPDKLYDIYD